MSKKGGDEVVVEPWLERAAVGDVFTSLGLIALFILCMLLPLVGPSGRTTDHYSANFSTFLLVLLVALGFGVGGLFSKLKRRKRDQSPLPRVSIALVAILVLMLGCLLTGLLAI